MIFLKEFLKKFFTIFTPLIGGGLVGFIISSHIDYKTLNKPPLSPPSFIFPVAWTIIYLLLGIGYYLIIKKNPNYKDKKLYYTSLIINYLWSIIFFIFKWYFVSIAWILILDITIVSLLKSFYRENKLSAYLQIPYLAWTLFATYLNIGIYLLN